MEERRDLPRWQFRRSLLYRILGENGGMSIGFLEDINLIGAKVYLRVPLAAQAKIRLLIRIPKDKVPITVEGEVIWQNPSKSRAKRFPTGVRLTRFRPEDKERILDYFSQQIHQTWWQEGASEKETNRAEKIAEL